MKLFPRLVFFGAGVPGIAAAGILCGAVVLFRASLQDELDRALLAQAAVEAVSLFDGTEGHVHLHMKSSPMLDTVRPFAPEAAIYDADGQQILVFPEESPAPAALGALPRVTTFSWSNDGTRRRVIVPVTDPKRDRKYALLLQASRARIDSSVERVVVGGGGAVVLLVLVLAALAGLWARRLTARVGALQAHMQHVANGELDVDPPPDPAGDEVAALRDAVADATRELRFATTARERFIADAAHELKTPLASMRVALDLALRRPRSESELVDALRQTRDEAVRLTTLAQRLLDGAAARAAPLHSDVSDVEALVQAALDSHAARAAERKVSLRRDGSAPATALDASAVRRALENLIDNALKVAPQDTEISVVVQSTADALTFIVRDAGPGIPEAERAAVFAPFHRLRQDGPGHGLGLALVREVARRHGGDAFVEDGPGGRVGFSVRALQDSARTERVSGQPRMR